MESAPVKKKRDELIWRTSRDISMLFSGQVLWSPDEDTIAHPVPFHGVLAEVEAYVVGDSDTWNRVRAGGQWMPHGPKLSSVRSGANGWFAGNLQFPANAGSGGRPAVQTQGTTQSAYRAATMRNGQYESMAGPCLAHVAVRRIYHTIDNPSGDVFTGPFWYPLVDLNAARGSEHHYPECKSYWIRRWDGGFEFRRWPLP